MDLSDALTDALLVAALVAVVGLAVLVVAQGRALRQLRRSYGAAFAGTDATHLLDAVRQQADELDELRAAVDEAVPSAPAAPAADPQVVPLPLRDTPGDAPGGLTHLAVQRMALVRYDAFPDMGASLSFSLALLDDNLDGCVLTGITGRAESRVYCKPVGDGQSDQSLSDEEMAAIDAAANGEPVVWAPAPRVADDRSRRTHRRRSA